MRFGIAKSDNSSDQSENEETAPDGSGGDQQELEGLLGYTFKDKMWLTRALTHRSAQARGDQSDYERLEFLGDAVLDLAIADLLLEHHVEAREGELSKMRAALVNTQSLAEISRELQLSKFIILSRGERANGGNERPSILADVFESIIGGMYRDSGYDVARERIRTYFGERLSNVIPQDPKTELQEVLHVNNSEPPKYLLECVEGPEHAPTFVSVVEVDGEIVGRGRGTTKKASQQEAAAEALTKLDPDSAEDTHE